MPKILSLPLITILSLLTLSSSLRMHLQKISTVTYDSLKSQVTSPIDYKYYDNLNSPSSNFYYGTITKQAYEMAVKLYKMDNYQQCSAATPYATKDMQSCMMCPKERPLFNLGTRVCEECRVNINEKCNALFNVTAPASTTTASVNGASSGTSAAAGSASTTTTASSTTPGTVVNSSGWTKPLTNTTTTSTTPTTATTASPTTPTTSPSSASSSSTSDSSFVVEWKPKPKQPEPTDQTANNTNTDIPTDFNIFQPIPFSQNNTLNQNYTIEYRVVSNQTNQTANQTNTTLIAQSKGPNATFSNQECPSATPFYNSDTKTCENCKENEEYIPPQKKCLSIIWVSSPKTKYVILKEPDQLLKANLNIAKANPERTVRTCPIDKPLAVNNSCMACEGDKIFNFTSQVCQNGCPDGLKFSEENSKCIVATFLTNSQAQNILSPLRDFEEFRTEQKKRVKSSAQLAECPLEKPFSIKGICSACPDSLPYFNIESQKCETCTRNRDYNRYSRKCESNNSSGLEIKRIVPNIF